MRGSLRVAPEPLLESSREATAEFYPHLVEAGGPLADGAAEQKESVVHLGVVRQRARTVEARSLESDRVRGVQLVPGRMFEVRTGFLDGNGVEALDARLSLHACPFVARFFVEASSLQAPDERNDERQRDARAEPRPASNTAPEPGSRSSPPEGPIVACEGQQPPGVPFICR